MAGRSAAFIAAVLLLAVAVQGQGIPSSSECQSRVNSIGQTGLLARLSGCQKGASPQCCTQANGLVGFPGSGQLAGCLCNADVLEATLSGIESNSLAKNAGVTRASVQAVFEGCNIPTAGRSGSCPSGGASVAVSAPGATVNVGGSPAPSSGGGGGGGGGGGASSSTPAAVSVQAPGTNVQVGGGSPASSSSASSAASTPAPAPAPAASYGKFSKHPFLSKMIASKGHHKWGRKLFQDKVNVAAPAATVAVSKASANSGSDVSVTAPGTTVQVGGSPASAAPAVAAATVQAPTPTVAPAAPTVPTPAPAATSMPCWSKHGCFLASVHGKMAAAYQAHMQNTQSKMSGYASSHEAAQTRLEDALGQIAQSKMSAHSKSGK